VYTSTLFVANLFAIKIEYAQSKIKICLNDLTCGLAAREGHPLFNMPIEGYNYFILGHTPLYQNRIPRSYDYELQGNSVC